MIKVEIKGDNQLRLALEKASKGIKNKAQDGLKDVAKHLQKEVQSKFGKYQSGWPKLKRESVIAKYRRKGGGIKGVRRNKFTRLAGKANTALGADNPLVLFSQLRDSIDYEVNNMEAVVFSDVVYAAVHEYGYRQVPSRSYMRLTLWQEEDAVVQIIKNRIGNIL